MSSNKPNITHVLFDMDGLILGMSNSVFTKNDNNLLQLIFEDTETRYSVAYGNFLKQFGHEFTFELKSKQSMN